MPNTFPTLLLGLQSIQIRVLQSSCNWGMGPRIKASILDILRYPAGWRRKGMHPFSMSYSTLSCQSHQMLSEVWNGRKGREGFLECWRGTKCQERWRDDGSAFIALPHSQGWVRASTFCSVSEEPMCFMFTFPARRNINFPFLDRYQKSM